MCTQTHFAFHPRQPSPWLPAMIRPVELAPAASTAPRFQVVLAGNAFFHITEISTGRVRGFRSSHNDACALARVLELRP